jgi:predicted ATPase
VGLDIALLGGLVVTRDGVPVDVRAPKQRALLALLALENGASVPADRLIDSLWGATPPKSVAKNLQVLVGRLRASLEHDRAVLESTADGYRIDPDRCSIDICGFERLVARGRGAVERSDWRAGSDDLRTALALWRGESLGSLELEEWALPHVARLQDLRTAALEHALHADLELGRHDDVLPELEQAVVLHPHRERIRCLHMLALYRAGRQSEALDSFHAARAALDELGLEPGPDLRALQRRILEQDPALAAPSQGRHLLRAIPRPRTSTIGRQRELRELAVQVTDPDGSRLTTITGWAGVGKTRVASELAVSLEGSFDELVWVELAPLQPDGSVIRAIAAAFGISAPDEEVVAAVAQALGDRSVLLVLDNFEHVVSQRDVVGELLAAGRSLRVVVTSRIALGVYGELLFAIDPLPTPTDAELDDPTFDIHSSASLALFEERAYAAKSPELLNHQNAKVIAAICARVDGLPLAIELAAARMSLLSPSDLLARLDKRLEMLDNGPVDRSPRQRSLRAAIEWSFELLDPSDQVIFRTLGAFRGGCALESVTAIVNPNEPVAVLDGLERLLAHGLIHRERDVAGRPRLVQLETIAEYAREQLDQDQRAPQTYRAHALGVIAQLRSAEPMIPSDSTARESVRSELSNVRAAFDWAEAHDPALAVTLVEHLGSFILREGWYVEGAELARRAASLDTPDGASAKLSLLAGQIAHFRGESDECRAHLEAARARFESDGDHAGLAGALNALGEAALIAEHFDDARRYFERSLDLAEEVSERWTHAMAIGNLGNVHLDMHELDAAEARFRAAAVEFEALGDEMWSICMRMNIGCVSWCRGDNAIALEAFRRAAIDHAACGNRSFSTQSRGNEVRALLEMGEWSDAIIVGDAAVGEARKVGDGLVLIHVLSLVAVAHYEQGNRSSATEMATEAIERAITSDRVRYVHLATAVMALCALDQGQRDAVVAWLNATDRSCFDDTTLDRRLVARLKSEWPDAEEISRTDDWLKARCSDALRAWRLAAI